MKLTIEDARKRFFQKKYEMQLTKMPEKEYLKLKEFKNRNWFIISFTYTTKRGNKRNYFRAVYGSCEDLAIEYFNHYIAEFNQKKPYKALLDVKITGVQRIGHALNKDIPSINYFDSKYLIKYSYITKKGNLKVKALRLNGNENSVESDFFLFCATCLQKLAVFNVQILNIAKVELV